jgi:hypothetical protein
MIEQSGLHHSTFKLACKPSVPATLFSLSELSRTTAINQAFFPSLPRTLLSCEEGRKQQPAVRFQRAAAVKKRERERFAPIYVHSRGTIDGRKSIPVKHIHTYMHCVGKPSLKIYETAAQF